MHPKRKKYRDTRRLRRLALSHMTTLLLSLFIAIFGFGAMADNGPESQLVVVHSKGDNWPSNGTISFDDPRIQEHGKYWGSQSIVEKGGPMPGTGGGMMLLKDTTSFEAALKIASEDPAVKNKLLKAEVRQWLLLIDNSSRTH